jgi:Alcohol dehydrogenase GroES-associated
VAVTFNPAGTDLRPCRPPGLRARLVIEVNELGTAVMKAIVYHGPGQKAWEEVPDPEITDDGDVFARAADTGALKVVLTR